MKFVHIADLHLDSPLIKLSEKETLGDKRRLEQRKILKKVIEYVKQEKIQYLFISGDLYEHQYVKQSTIEYINNLFKEIPNTNIYIAPGNHDPYLKNSFYNKFNWNKNVKIFKGNIEKVETEDAEIYGYGFTDFVCSNSGIEEIKLNKSEKPQILVIHGTLDGAAENPYNPMKTKILEEKGFSYIALGHIHKVDYANKEIVYPGSIAALGFDEIGEHGMIVGELCKDNVENVENQDKEMLNIKFIPLDEEKFTLKELDVTSIISKEELIEKINQIKIEENEYAEIILTGKRNIEINKYEIIKYIENPKIIKLKDETKLDYDLEKLKNETTLKGLFVKKILEEYDQKQTNEEKEIIEKAIEIAFDALD